MKYAVGDVREALTRLVDEFEQPAPPEIHIAWLGAVGLRPAISYAIHGPNDDGHATWTVFAVTEDELIIITGGDTGTDQDSAADIQYGRDIRLRQIEAWEPNNLPKDYWVRSRWVLTLADGRAFTVPSQKSTDPGTWDRAEALISALRILAAGTASS